MLHKIWIGSNNSEIPAEGVLRESAFRPTLRALRGSTTQKIRARYLIPLPIIVKPEKKIHSNVNLEYEHNKTGGETVAYLTLSDPHAAYQVEASKAICAIHDSNRFLIVTFANKLIYRSLQ